MKTPGLIPQGGGHFLQETPHLQHISSVLRGYFLSDLSQFIATLQGQERLFHDLIGVLGHFSRLGSQPGEGLRQKGRTVYPDFRGQRRGNGLTAGWPSPGFFGRLSPVSAFPSGNGLPSADNDSFLPKALTA